jgi:ribosome-associated protein
MNKPKHSVSTSHDEQDDQPTGVSKTQRKRDMENLQRLGEALVKLDTQSLALFSLSDSLKEAILEAQQIKAHGALRRQLQYVGKLMRDVDADRLQQEFNAFQDGSQTRKRYDLAIEQWRERLLHEPQALDALVAAYPQTDADLFRELVAHAKEELDYNEKAAAHASTGMKPKPPVAFRKLYQQLKTLIPFALLS